MRRGSRRSPAAPRRRSRRTPPKSWCIQVNHADASHAPGAAATSIVAPMRRASSNSGRISRTRRLGSLLDCRVGTQARARGATGR
jgi:hypothetical protein